MRSLPLDWFRSYLTDRTNVVRVEMSKSDVSVLNIGVPQGFLLGPLLSLFYINDLLNDSDKFSSILFADDTALLSTSECLYDVISTLGEEMVKVGDWCCVNRLR